MTFEEKIKRDSQEDKIEIGNIVDNALKGDFGYLLRAIINGIIAEELFKSKRDHSIPPERVLGRIEALTNLTETLDVMVDIKNQLVEEKVESNKVQQLGTGK
jgi:hypothetical protein